MGCNWTFCSSMTIDHICDDRKGQLCPDDSIYFSLIHWNNCKNFNYFSKEIIRDSFQLHCCCSKTDKHHRWRFHWPVLTQISLVDLVHNYSIKSIFNILWPAFGVIFVFLRIYPRTNYKNSISQNCQRLWKRPS